MSRPTVGFVSLGLRQGNRGFGADLLALRAEGYGFSQTYTGADVVVVNTCGFIDAAVEESLAAIDEALSANGQVIVTGCLGARAEMLKEKFPALLAVTGPQATAEVLSANARKSASVQEPLYHLLPRSDQADAPALCLSPDLRGCNHKYSFCIIPTMRGSSRQSPARGYAQEAGAVGRGGGQRTAGGFPGHERLWH